MKRRIRLTENDLHRIVRNSIKRILREGKPMPADENPNWLDDDEYYFDYPEVPIKHRGDVSYFNYKIPNNYEDYWDFDEDGLNGKTNINLTADDTPEDAWNAYDNKQLVIHKGNGRFGEGGYVKRAENPNYAIPNDEIYRRIGNPSQYDTYTDDAFPSDDYDDYDDGIKPGIEL